MYHPQLAKNKLQRIKSTPGDILYRESTHDLLSTFTLKLPEIKRKTVRDQKKNRQLYSGIEIQRALSPQLYNVSLTDILRARSRGNFQKQLDQPAQMRQRSKTQLILKSIDRSDGNYYIQKKEFIYPPTILSPSTKLYSRLQELDLNVQNTYKTVFNNISSPDLKIKLKNEIDKYDLEHSSP